MLFFLEVSQTSGRCHSPRGTRQNQEPQGECEGSNPSKNSIRLRGTVKEAGKGRSPQAHPRHQKNRAGERREGKCGSYPGTCVFLTCFRIIAGFPSPSMPDSEVSVGPTLRPCDCMFRRLLRPRTPLRGRFGIAACEASCRDNAFLTPRGIPANRQDKRKAKLNSLPQPAWAGNHAACSTFDSGARLNVLAQRRIYKSSAKQSQECHSLIHPPVTHCILIHPVLFLPHHAFAARHFASRTRPVE